MRRLFFVLTFYISHNFRESRPYGQGNPGYQGDGHPGLHREQFDDRKPNYDPRDYGPRDYDPRGPQPYQGRTDYYRAPPEGYGRDHRHRR